MKTPSSRRTFLQQAGLASLNAAALSWPSAAQAAEPVIPGFERVAADPNASAGWKPVSDRKVSVGKADGASPSRCQHTEAKAASGRFCEGHLDQNVGWPAKVASQAEALMEQQISTSGGNE